MSFEHAKKQLQKMVRIQLTFSLAIILTFLLIDTIFGKTPYHLKSLIIQTLLSSSFIFIALIYDYYFARKKIASSDQQNASHAENWYQRLYHHLNLCILLSLALAYQLDLGWRWYLPFILCYLFYWYLAYRWWLQFRKITFT